MLAISRTDTSKPVLLISLVGTLVGYLLFAYAIHELILWLLFAARMLPGFTGRTSR